MDALIEILRKVHKDYQKLKGVGAGLNASRVAKAKCAEYAQKKHLKTLAALESNAKLTSAAKQAAIKSAKVNLERELRECEG